MTTPLSPLADADALFASALQPVLDLAALAARVVGLGAAGLLGLGLVAGGLAVAVRVASGAGVRLPVWSSTPSTPMTRSLLLLAALLLAAPAFAQSGLDRLTPYAGTYALDGEPHQNAGTFDGSLTVTPVLGGHFQQWDWEMTMRGDGFEEVALLRFIAGRDPATGALEIYRFDSRDADSPTVTSNPGDPNRGTVTFDGDALVMTWSTANPEDPTQTGTFRNVVRRTADGLRVDTEVVPADGSPVVAIATTRAARR